VIDMNFTPTSSAAITASTLIVYGDRDFLDPVEMDVDLYRAIPRSRPWVVPNKSHVPVFLDGADQFVRFARALFKKQNRASKSGVRLSSQETVAPVSQSIDVGRDLSPLP
jgi:hypothetical protein